MSNSIEQVQEKIRGGRDLANAVAGKPSEDIGWRDAARLGQAVSELSDLAERLAAKAAGQAGALDKVRELADALEGAVGEDDDTRALELVERIRELA